MSDTTKPEETTVPFGTIVDGKVSVPNWGFQLMRSLQDFIVLALKEKTPMYTSINCTFPDMPDKPVLHLWATSDDRTPITRMQEILADRRAERGVNEVLLSALKMWRDHFKRLDEDSEPGDRLAIERRRFFAKHLAATEDAIALAESL